MKSSQRRQHYGRDQDIGILSEYAEYCVLIGLLMDSRFVADCPFCSPTWNLPAGTRFSAQAILPVLNSAQSAARLVGPSLD